MRGSGSKRGGEIEGVPNWKQFFDTVVHPASSTGFSARPVPGYSEGSWPRRRRNQAASPESVLLPEFDQYGELIAVTDHPLAGLPLRGEGSGFTDRVQRTVATVESRGKGRRSFTLVWHAFEHKRCS